ncbi:MAG TPA: ComEA family DNA-binding protein [Phycisphaerales bacterium]|nr:ComEA family DNA-binding protein [Phycisphaerales bacterium]
MAAAQDDHRRLPDGARWVAVGVLGLAGLVGVIRAWVSAPGAMLPAHATPTGATEVAAAVNAERGAEAAPAPAESAEPPGSIARRINVNTASASELDLLPGIGPALAGRIIADREANGPFRTLDDLDRVSGIGPKTVAKLAPYASAE